MNEEKIIHFPDVNLSVEEKEHDRDAIIEIVVMPEITETIEAAKLDPARFVLDDESMHTFMTKSISYRNMDGSFGSIYYDYRTEDTLYRVECVIFWDEETVSTQTNLYKLENYRKGNQEWLHFYADEWERGPGEMFYNAKKILRSHRWG